MLNKLQLPKKLRNKVDKELEIIESIRWIGQPIPRFCTATFMASLVFGIPWTSFAIFWILGVSEFKFPDFREGIQPRYLFALSGIPSLFIGFWILSNPIWIWLAAKNTVYLITNRRAISIQVAVSTTSTTIKSYSPKQLKNIYRKERANDTGDVIIEIRRWKDSEGNEQSEEIGFMGIRNPKEVEKILKHLAQSD